MSNNISFILRCHNHEKTIGRCIESIVSEAKRYWGIEFEIVILHDGTDNTVQEALKYNKVASIRTRFAPQGPGVNRKYNLHAYIDPSFTIPLGWIGFITQTFLNPNVNAVTGPVLNSDWKLHQHVWYMIKWYWRKLLDASTEPGNLVLRAQPRPRYSNQEILVMDERARVFGSNS